VLTSLLTDSQLWPAYKTSHRLVWPSFSSTKSSFRDKVIDFFRCKKYLAKNWRNALTLRKVSVFEGS